jgi:uncharacterized protein YaiE (UPF0345 family)
MQDKANNVEIKLKANVYFDGKVVSHTLLHKDGKKQTVGIIYPGTYKFDTGAPERMDVIAGTCRVKLAGAAAWTTYQEGTFFQVPGKSSFEISVETGLCEYLCSFE